MRFLGYRGNERIKVDRVSSVAQAYYLMLFIVFSHLSLTTTPFHKRTQRFRGLK